MTSASKWNSWSHHHQRCRLSRDHWRNQSAVSVGPAAHPSYSIINIINMLFFISEDDLLKLESADQVAEATPPPSTSANGMLDCLNAEKWQFDRGYSGGRSYVSVRSTELNFIDNCQLTIVTWSRPHTHKSQGHRIHTRNKITHAHTHTQHLYTFSLTNIRTHITVLHTHTHTITSHTHNSQNRHTHTSQQHTHTDTRQHHTHH